MPEWGLLAFRPCEIDETLMVNANLDLTWVQGPDVVAWAAHSGVSLQMGRRAVSPTTQVVKQLPSMHINTKGS